MKNIPFNKPYMVGKELEYIKRAHENGHLSGDGPFTGLCHAWLEKHTGCKKAFLVHSGTAALEMAALLSDIKPGDEIIMPSYTFVSSANAFVLRGGIPVFVDIRPDTLNMDETKIENAITDKTKAVMPVHYAGVGCEMDTIMGIAGRHNLLVIEDAAHGVMASYKNRPLGSMGHMATFSFHETKNITSGEGGALLINDPRFIKRAEIIREKGTNRGNFFRGEVDKYTWIDIGSSYLPSEMNAAFLWAQMEEADVITKRRLDIWRKYHEALKDYEERGLIRRPIVPAECAHNAHMYYILLPDREKRDAFIRHMKKSKIGAIFHYVPLHESLAGKRYCRQEGNLPVTVLTASRVVRLPLWTGMVKDHIERVLSGAISGIMSEDNVTTPLKP